MSDFINKQLENAKNIVEKGLIKPASNGIGILQTDNLPPLLDIPAGDSLCQQHTIVMCNIHDKINKKNTLSDDELTYLGISNYLTEHAPREFDDRADWKMTYSKLGKNESAFQDFEQYRQKKGAIETFGNLITSLGFKIKNQTLNIKNKTQESLYKIPTVDDQQDSMNHLFLYAKKFNIPVVFVLNRYPYVNEQSNNIVSEIVAVTYNNKTKLFDEITEINKNQPIIQFSIETDCNKQVFIDSIKQYGLIDFMGQKMQPYYEKMRHKHTSIRPLKVLPNTYNDQSMKSYEDQSKYMKDFKNFTIRHAACYTIGEAESKCDRQNLWTLRNKKSLLSPKDVNLLIDPINNNDNKTIHGSDSHLNCVRTIKNQHYNGTPKRTSSAGDIF